MTAAHHKAHELCACRRHDPDCLGWTVARFELLIPLDAASCLLDTTGSIILLASCRYHPLLPVRGKSRGIVVITPFRSRRGIRSRRIHHKFSE